MTMPLRRAKNHRKLYFLAGYIFLIIVNVVILILGIMLIFRLLRYF